MAGSSNRGNHSRSRYRRTGEGANKGNSLATSISGVSAELRLQGKAWAEVLASLREYRSFELPDLSLSVPDTTAWQTLTEDVRAYSAAVLAIPPMPDMTATQSVDSVATTSETATTTNVTIDVTTITDASAAINAQQASWDALRESVAEFEAASVASLAAVISSVEELTAAVPETILPESTDSELPAQMAAIAAQTQATSDAITELSATLATLTAALSETAPASEQAKGSSESLNAQLQSVTRTIEIQEVSWRNFSAQMIGSFAHIAGSVLSFSGPVVGAIVTHQLAQQRLAASTAAAAAAQAAAVAPTVTLGAANAAATPPTFSLAAAVNFLLSPIVLATAAIAAVTATIYALTRAATETTDSTTATADSAKNTADSFVEMAYATSGVKKEVQDLTKSLTALETQRLTTKGTLLSEEESAAIHKVGLGIGDVIEAASNLKAALEQPFIDGQNAVKSYAVYLLGIKDAADTAASTLKPVANAIDYVTERAKGGIRGIQEWLYVWKTGATDEQAAQFVKEGEAITERTARTERLTAAIESQRGAYARFAAAQANATEVAAHNAEVSRIGTLGTIADLNQAEQALQRKNAADIAGGEKALRALKERGATESEIAAQKKANEDTLKRNIEAGGAIAGQKQKVESGTFQSAAAQQIKSAADAYRSLVLGADEAAVAVLRSKGATEAEVAALRELQHQINAVKQARDMEKLATQARNELFATEQANLKTVTDRNAELRDKIDVVTGAATEAEIAIRQMTRQGIDKGQAEGVAELGAELAKLTLAKTAELAKLTLAKTGDTKITALKDQIDILTGSATEAEVAMRELTRQGFSEEQVAEIGALTSELDRLKDANKKQPKGAQDKTDVPVAFAGSKEAAEIALRGVGGGDRSVSLAEQQLAVQKEIAKGVNAPNQGAVVPIGVPPLPAAPVAEQPEFVQPIAPRNAPLSLIPKPGQMATSGNATEGVDAAQQLIAPPQPARQAEAIQPGQVVNVGPFSAQQPIAAPPIEAPATPAIAPPVQPVIEQPQPPQPAEPKLPEQPQAAPPTQPLVADEAKRRWEQSIRDSELMGIPFDNPEAELSRKTARESVTPQITTAPPLTPPAAPLPATPAPALTTAASVSITTPAPPVIATPTRQATATPAASFEAAKTLIPSATRESALEIPPAPAVVMSKPESPRIDLPLQRAGLTEQPKVSGLSERSTDPRRESREGEIVGLLRQMLAEDKLATQAIREIEMPDIQVAIV